MWKSTYRPCVAKPDPASLSQINEEATNCFRCPRLVAWREEVAVEKRASFKDETYWGRPLPGWGDANARLMILGLAPAAHGGNRTGRIFTGDRSGDWLFAALHRAGFANQPTSISIDDGLALADCYITAAVKCAPPANKPTIDERKTCTETFLEREMEALTNMKVVVCLGKFAYDALAVTTGLRKRPAFGHLVEARLNDRVTIVNSFHPSQQNTFTKKLTEPMFDSVFARARALIDA